MWPPLWLFSCHYRFWRWILAVAAKSRRLDADVLTGEEVERLIRACSGRAPTGLRNRALVVLAWRSGLRISEVLGLRPKDIDLDAGTVRVQHGKGDRYRVVGLDPGGAAIVLAWINRRRQLGISNRHPLICTL